jgi:type IV secretory pathway VirB2 component (pilin)
MNIPLLNRSMAKALAKGVTCALVAASPLVASAAINLPIIDGVGCDVVNWMKGPLAILVFLIVAVATFVIGLFAKMDWTKILTVVIIYGILQGLAGLLLSNGAISLPSCFT